MTGANEWLRLRVVREDLPGLDGGSYEPRWEVYVGTDLTLLNGTNRLDPAVMIAYGETRERALENARKVFKRLAAAGVQGTANGKTRGVRRNGNSTDHGELRKDAPKDVALRLRRGRRARDLP